MEVLNLPDKTYICIDLKSFYASVECADRGLDPFTTNLVVADPSRTEKTICLAITPAMKKLGVKNRCRVFEIPHHIEYIMATPRMKHYMEVSAQIYQIYLRYICPEDIHVYSVDECFIDITPYTYLYEMTAYDLADKLRQAVFDETHIAASVGIGTNMFLCKIALDILAKKSPDNIAYLDEELFRQKLWNHKPLTDFWNIGPGITRRLKKMGVNTLRQVCEVDQNLLYAEFGVNAQYLIDHAHGYEPCTIADIASYETENLSLSTSQILPCNYNYDDALIVMKEMA
ncbi:MAG: DNA repair protein, partial [Clostridia bacterium]|nr:DNA repair protein [Clostridia bacterium]